MSDKFDSDPPRPLALANGVGRWIDRPTTGADPADQAAELLRRAPVPPPLSPQAHRRIRARLAMVTPPRPQKLRRPALQWAIAASLFLGSGVVIAARGVDRWWSARPEAPAAPPPQDGDRKQTRRTRPSRRPLVGTPVAGPPEGAVVPATGFEAAMGVAEAGVPAPPLAPSVVPLRALPQAPIESTLSIEAQLLNGAMARLRQQRDGSGALARLERYLRRFPRGTLVEEAQIARVDALLMLGRQTEALAALDTLRLDHGGREEELRVIRGELRGSSECRRAIADFDGILNSQTATSDLVERALHGRAVCQMRAGAITEAKRDAERYLQQFPTGRYGDDARRMIAPSSSWSPPSRR